MQQILIKNNLSTYVLKVVYMIVFIVNFLTIPVLYDDTCIKKGEIYFERYSLVDVRIGMGRVLAFGLPDAHNQLIFMALFALMLAVCSLMALSFVCAPYLDSDNIRLYIWIETNCYPFMNLLLKINFLILISSGFDTGTDNGDETAFLSWVYLWTDYLGILLYCGLDVFNQLMCRAFSAYMIAACCLMVLWWAGIPIMIPDQIVLCKVFLIRTCILSNASLPEVVTLLFVICLCYLFAFGNHHSNVYIARVLYRKIKTCFYDLLYYHDYPSLFLTLNKKNSLHSLIKGYSNLFSFSFKAYDFHMHLFILI